MSQRKSGNKSRNNLTQQSNEERLLEETDINEIANNVVRYIIYRAGENSNLTRAELTRNVIPKVAGKFEEVITIARNILKDVYGYSLLTSDSKKGKEKQYMVSNRLPYVKDTLENTEEIPTDIHKVLLLLILSHIFMSNNMVSDVSLYSFLQSFGINAELKHPIFGDVTEYITKVLVRKHYLITEVDSISRRQTFQWGMKAEKEISKMAILEFVHKIYKDTQPKQWVSQYQVAQEQAFENHLGDQSISMEQDTQEA